MASQHTSFERIEKEYGSLRRFNISRWKLDSRELLLENRRLLLENREMLLAIIKHLDVPYEKPPMGFRKE